MRGKTMAKKPAEKKHPKPVIEEKQEVLPPRQEFRPWLLVGILLLIFVLIPYMGWAYLSNWYWYYGIDPVQLDLPFILLFEEGLVMFGMHLIFMAFILAVFVLLRALILYFHNLLSRRAEIELARLFSIRRLFQGSIHYLILAYLLMIQVLIVLTAKANENYHDLIFPPNSVLWVPIAYLLAAVLLIRALGDLLSILPIRFKKRLRLDVKSPIDDGAQRLVLGALAAFAAMAFFNGTKAIGEASIGWRDLGYYQSVRPVTLESNVPIPGLEDYQQDCDCHTYIYGPLAYIAANDEYIFLIPWVKGVKSTYDQFPPLYQVERVSTYSINIIPHVTNP
jgi:hypothetical protein